MTSKEVQKVEGKVYWLDREVLKVNEKYVEGHGWISEEEYQRLLYLPGNSQLWTKIRLYNVQYRRPDGVEGQMDIEFSDFWRHRKYVGVQF